MKKKFLKISISWNQGGYQFFKIIFHCNSKTFWDFLRTAKNAIYNIVNVYCTPNAYDIVTFLNHHDQFSNLSFNSIKFLSQSGINHSNSAWRNNICINFLYSYPNCIWFFEYWNFHRSLVIWDNDVIIMWSLLILIRDEIYTIAISWGSTREFDLINHIKKLDILFFLCSRTV